MLTLRLHKNIFFMWNAIRVYFFSIFFVYLFEYRLLLYIRSICALRTVFFCCLYTRNRDHFAENMLCIRTSTCDILFSCIVRKKIKSRCYQMYIFNFYDFFQLFFFCESKNKRSILYLFNVTKLKQMTLVIILCTILQLFVQCKVFFDF